VGLNNKMKNEKNSKLFAGIIGPTLIILSITEYLNLDIWATNIPAITYLNGLFFLVAGLFIIKVHNIWKNWPTIITITGWLILLLGLFRMIFPKAEQANEGILPNIFFLIMLALGTFLCFKAYFEGRSS
jgi:uncharacterized membrane protein